MNSVLVTVHHNDPEICIDDPEYFRQYHSWLISGHEGNTLHPTTTHVSTAQLYIGSRSHVFTNITMFIHIIPVNFNVQILNDRKYPEKVLALSQ